MSANKMENLYQKHKLLLLLSDMQVVYEAYTSEINIAKKPLHFVYPSGKPMIPHLLRCQGLAVPPRRDGFALGRLESGASSTFAQLG
jgi:hypothetical protein